MKRTFETITCDLCGAYETTEVGENSTTIESYCMPKYADVGPDISFMPMDLCLDCLKKHIVIKVECKGGEKKYTSLLDS